MGAALAREGSQDGSVRGVAAVGVAVSRAEWQAAARLAVTARLRRMLLLLVLLAVLCLLSLLPQVLALDDVIQQVHEQHRRQCKQVRPGVVAFCPEGGRAGAGKGASGGQQHVDQGGGQDRAEACSTDRGAATKMANIGNCKRRGRVGR
jgi:hypothetical protein